MPAPSSKNWFQTLLDFFVSQPPTFRPDTTDAAQALPLAPHAPLTPADFTYAAMRTNRDYGYPARDVGKGMTTVLDHANALLPLLYDTTRRSTGPRTVSKSNGFNKEFAALLAHTTVPQSAIDGTRFLLGNDVRPTDSLAIAQFFPRRTTPEDTVVVNDGSGMNAGTLAHEMQHRLNARAYGRFPAEAFNPNGLNTNINHAYDILKEYLAALAEGQQKVRR